MRTKILTIILFFSCFLLLSYTAQAQIDVWPGDANNSGKATNVDLLYLAKGFGTFGPQRAGIDSTWAPYQAQPWNEVLPNSNINYAHLDSDGDGDIDTTDADIIQINYNLENNQVTQDSFQIGTVGVNPPLYLDVEGNSASPNQTLSIPIILGDTMSPVFNILGLAFTIDYDETNIDPNSVSFTPNQAFLGSDNNTLLSVQFNDPLNGLIEIAVSRTQFGNVSGSGTVGWLNLVIEGDIFDPKVSFETLRIMILDDQLNETIAVGRSNDLDISTSIHQAIKDAAVLIHPNPTRNQLFIESQDYKIQSIKLYNNLGQVAFEQEFSIFQNRRDIQLPDLPIGIYYISIQTPQGIIGEKLQIAP